MTYEEFANKVAEEMGKRMPEYDGFTIEEVNKSNIGTLKGLAASVEDGAVPIIYLEKYYYDYEDGQSFTDVCDHLERQYREAAGTVAPDDRIIEPEYVRNHLIVKLLNYDLNKGLLDTYVNRRVDDYAIVPYVEVDLGDHMGEVKFTPDHFESFEFDMDEVIDEAIIRTQQLYPAVLNTMTDRLYTMGGTDRIKNYLDGNEEVEEDIMILTNTRGMEGAVAMYYPGVMQKIGELMGDFFLVPSSIHEFLVIKVQFNIDEEYLSRTVLNVNRTMVDETDWLGTRVLRYSNSTGSIET